MEAAAASGDHARVETGAVGAGTGAVAGGLRGGVGTGGRRLDEHQFLLLDGSEVSLWEVEHTATPDGRHMCEVYEDEHAARGAMESRSRVR
ncbi:hypothetical protein STANM309S_03986 [Streptomyces tanashiensis]